MAVSLQLLCRPLSEGQKPTPLAFFPDYQKLTGDAERAVGADDNAEEQHQDKIVYGSSAKEKQSQEDKYSGQGGI